jgi:hypothetical protein
MISLTTTEKKADEDLAEAGTAINHDTAGKLICDFFTASGKKVLNGMQSSRQNSQNGWGLEFDKLHFWTTAPLMRL